MNILIVDDDQFVSLSLKTILEASGEIQVLGIGNNGKEAVTLYKKYHPQVLLMDIRMDEMTGLEAAELILKEDPDAKILFLTTFLDDEYIVRSLKLGAKGYILKQDFESLLPSLKAVVKGQNVFGNEIVTRFPDFISRTKSSHYNYAAKGITGKELEIIELVAQGCSNREIADQLCLSEGTTRNYLSSILSVFYYKN